MAKVTRLRKQYKQWKFWRTFWKNAQRDASLFL